MLTVALLLYPAAVRAQAVWDMPTEYPQSAMSGLGVTTFAKRVAEQSAGKLQILSCGRGAKPQDLPLCRDQAEGKDIVHCHAVQTNQSMLDRISCVLNDLRPPLVILHCLHL